METDYKKAYKNLVAKVKNAHLFAQTDSTKNVLEDILPELAESEDERIRKELIEFIQWSEDRGMTRHDFHQAKRPSEWLAWLEKQKEPLPIPNKFSGLKSLMLQYLQSASNRKDDTEIESDTDLWGRKILDYVWKHDGEQKEQKPIQTSNEREYVRMLKSIVSDFIRDKKPEDVSFYQRVYDWLDGRHIEQKPAEWSEEDEDNLRRVTRIIEDNNSDWKELIAWLKSLRPRPHWKPSEEQMEALYEAAQEAPIDREDGNALYDLYEQLKSIQ